MQTLKPKARPHAGGWVLFGMCGAVFGATLTDVLRLHYRCVLLDQTAWR